MTMTMRSMKRTVALILGLTCCRSPSDAPAAAEGCTVIERSPTTVIARCGAMQLTVSELKAAANDDTFAEQFALFEHQLTGGVTRRDRITADGKTFETMVRESNDGSWRGEMRLGPCDRGTRVITCGGRTGKDSGRCAGLFEAAMTQGLDVMPRRLHAADAVGP